VIFRDTALPGVLVLAPEPHADERGFFARTFCAEEMAQHGLDPTVAQCSIAWNRSRGTVRGMHFQAAPHAESKLVRCTRGALLDVVLDLRHDSPAYRRHVAVELTAENRLAVWVPPGCAHGYQTLADDTEASYQISTPHAPEAARGVRWDDPAFGIGWPLPVAVISARDQAWADYTP
jgi:dTDP-4-dehydrorhamnose 3,5-epimerase